MKLGLTATSERGKALTKTGNENIIMELNVHGVRIGEVELYLHNDSENGTLNEPDEWLLLYRKDIDMEGDDIDESDIPPIIVAQGNIYPKNKNGNLNAKPL